MAEPGPLQWEAGVQEHLDRCVGEERVAAWGRALARPCLSVCLRVNTTRTSVQAVLQKLGAMGLEATAAPQGLPAVLLRGSGPHPLDLSAAKGEVVCTRHTGEALLKGAHLYAPGVLAASRQLALGDAVAVTVAIGGGGEVPRGTALPPWGGAAPPGARLCVGTGRLAQAPRALLSGAAQGLAVELTQRLYRLPACNGLLPGEVVLQGLPSLVAAHVLAPPRGALVLDMCAAPGGKATALAELMGDTGRIYALDRSHAKAAHIARLAAELGLRCVSAHRLDATAACIAGAAPPVGEAQPPGGPAAATAGSRPPAGDDSGPEPSQPPDPAVWEEELSAAAAAAAMGNPKVQQREAAREATMRAMGLPYTPKAQPGPQAATGARRLKGFLPASFPYILLDAPCSALGLRPRLEQSAGPEELGALAHYQRRLLEAAWGLLAPGGALVYSTCTLNPGECEGNVRRFLDAHPDMELAPQQPRLGGPGLVDGASAASAPQLEPEPGPHAAPDPAAPLVGAGGEHSARAPAAACPGEGGEGRMWERWLTPAEAALVQRFDPGDGEVPGFFIAKFRRKQG